MTAAKTNKGSVRQGFRPHLGGFLLGTQDMISFQHGVRRDEQTERVCAVFASSIPIRRKAYFFNFSIFEKTIETFKRKELPTKIPPKLRVNVVLNKEEAPMHDTTNTCSCDCGVRATVPSGRTVSRET